ncbi:MULTISPECIES: hypothetical protein [Tsukamurella]|uniref:Uncharacterized protein n=2 Tax=Tsukamurella TaxID=2060 RepID=A0A5C5RXK3_9ACTN|nr:MULTISPECIES: hypothetical protein [Tsukamurella]NMD56554.1 hypothetical protein [Tsukamurella columbiensis]TWS27514.1 hypothetical protein FK530_18530 [Tsukamurella conjunctivitidis]
MTAAAERTALLAAAVAVVLLLVAGLGAAFIAPEWLSLYTPAFVLPVLAQGLATGLRWRACDPVSKEAL